MWKWFALALVGMVLAGCASGSTIGAIPNRIRSDPAAASLPADRERLIGYALPRAYLTVKLVADNDRSKRDYRIIVSAPDLQPDDRYRMVIATRISPFADDSFTVKVDPYSGLLQSINVINDDRTDDILPALAATAGAIAGNRADGPRNDGGKPAGGVADNQVLLARVVFDPLDESDTTAAQATLCAALNKFYDATICVNAKTILVFSETDGRELARPPALSAEDVEALCSVGICTPSTRSLRVKLTVPGGASDEAIFQVPDGTRLVRLDFRRATFVKRETQATFNSGMPMTVTTTKPSEALGIALIPIRILRAGFGAFTEVIQLRINLDIIERKLEKPGDTAINVTPVTLPTQGDVPVPTAPASTQGEYPIPSLATLLEVGSAPLKTPAWNSALTIFVNKKEVVEAKRAKFRSACLRRDVEAIVVARSELRSAQADANTAALAANVDVPFAGLATEELTCAGGDATPTPAWSPSKTEFVASLDVAEGKELAFNEACSAGLKPAIATARGQLRDSRSKANTAAVAAGLDIPFPDLATDRLPCPPPGTTPPGT